MSKSLAVESMHRISKHFKDVASGKSENISDEVLEIVQLWDLREWFFGLDLNTALKKLRDARANKMVTNDKA